jgi:hypothetical protein
MHTKDILAQALRDAGLNQMADKAARGYYHDFLSDLAAPCIQLKDDLAVFAFAEGWPRRAEAKALLDRHINGDFDASKEESDAWAASEDGRKTFDDLVRPTSARDPLIGDRLEPTPPATKEQQIGRLAMRHEGEFWNAYYAEANTMEGALLLGSVRMKIVENEERKMIFMNMMRDAVGDILKAVTGQSPIWPTKPYRAPEHERSGHA